MGNSINRLRDVRTNVRRYQETCVRTIRAIQEKFQARGHKVETEHLQQHIDWTFEYLLTSHETDWQNISAPLSCLERCYKNCHRQYEDNKEILAESLLRHIEATQTLLPDKFMLAQPGDRMTCQVNLFDEDSFFQPFLPKSSRLSPAKQEFLFGQGVSKELMEQLDDVLLEDFKIVKHFQESGGFGTVMIARDSYGREVALKKIKLGSSKALTELQSILLSRRVPENPVIVKIYEIGIDVEQTPYGTMEGYVFYSMEAADNLNGMISDDYACYVPFTLEKLLEYRHLWGENDQTLINWQIMTTCLLVGGGALLHSQNLIHRDLKPANLGYFNGQLKIMDLGLLAEEGADVPFAGTPDYMPKTTCDNMSPQTASDDVYACGKILCQLYFKEDVYSGGMEGTELAGFMRRICSNDHATRYFNLCDAQTALQHL